MGTFELVLACVVATLGATLQGSVGFGLGMLAAPVLILIDPRMVPGPLLFSALVLTILLAHRDRASIDFGGLGWAVAGRVVGVTAGAAALAVWPSDRIALLFGTLVLLSVGISTSGFHFRPNRWTLAVAGSLSGFMGTTVSIGGPPMALVYQHAAGPRVRGTLSGFLVVGAAMSLVALWVVGRFGLEEVMRAGVLLPGIYAGYLASRWTVGPLDRGYTRKAVLVVSAIAGIVVILRHVG